MTRLPYREGVGNYVVPLVGAVIVSLETLRFGLTNESMIVLSSVRRPDGRPLDSVAQERVAQYLESISVI